MGTAVLRWASPTNRVLQNGAEANGEGAVFNLEGMYGSQTLQVAGEFTATVNFEVSQDKVHWEPILGYNVSTGVRSTSATAAGIYMFAVNGVKYFRARISDYTSGAVSVVATASPLPALLASAP